MSNVARGLPHVPVEDALRLVYARGQGVAKYERAAMTFLCRYLDEKEPMLKNLPKIVRELEQRRAYESKSGRWQA